MQQTYRIERRVGDTWQPIGEYITEAHAVSSLHHIAMALPMERHRLIMESILHDTHEPRHNR